MDDQEYLAAMVLNLMAQWQADTTKKPAMTPAQKYNLLVATVNSANTAGLWVDYTPPDILFAVDTLLDAAGFTEIQAMFIQEGEFWDGAFPVPYAP